MSRIRANTITNQNANGAPNFPDGITVSGVVTATVSNSTLGSLSVTGNATVGGTLGIGGTLTYEDVTNIDSVGLITARSGIKIGPTAGVAGTFFADGSYVTAGVVTATTFSGALAASNLTGALPAISGANLTNLPASGKATNLVINGAMTVQQRMDSTTTGGQNLSGIKTVDRFSCEFQGTDNPPTQIPVDVASGTTPYTLGFRRCFKIINGNQTSGPGTTDLVVVKHKIEAQNIATSGWNYLSASSNITLSFWVKSSVAQVFSGNLRTVDGTVYVYKFDTASLSANTWTKVTKTIPGNSNLTFNNDNGEGLVFHVYPFIGTDYTTSNSDTETWLTASSANYANDMTSTWYTTNDATFEITGVLLEVGDSASDFPHETYAETLLKCYRYFYAHRGMLWGITSAGDHLDLNLTFPVPMRTTPSRTQNDGSLLFKNRLDQNNSTSATTYSYSGVVSPTGDFWVARPASGDAWGVSYTSSDTHAVYYHVFEGTDKISYSWSAEL